MCRDSQSLAYFSIILTTFCLVMNFVIRKLGLVLGKLELAQLKEATLLKQVCSFPLSSLPCKSQPRQPTILWEDMKDILVA